MIFNLFIKCRSITLALQCLNGLIATKLQGNHCKAIFIVSNMVIAFETLFLTVFKSIIMALFDVNRILTCLLKIQKRLLNFLWKLYAFFNGY